jgi:hypothetical protein
METKEIKISMDETENITCNIENCTLMHVTLMVNGLIAGIARKLSEEKRTVFEMVINTAVKEAFNGGTRNETD